MNIFRAIISALLLTSASALQAACPNLSGNYICEGRQDSYRVSIFQSVDGEGTTSYTISYKIFGRRDEERTTTLIADGVERDNGNRRLRSSCGEDNTLRIHTAGEGYATQAVYSETNDGYDSFMIKTRYENLVTGNTQDSTMTCGHLTGVY